MQLTESGEYMQNIFRMANFDFQHPDVNQGLALFLEGLKIDFDETQYFDGEVFKLIKEEESVMIDFGHSSEDNSIFFSITRQFVLQQFDERGKQIDGFLYGCYLGFMGEAKLDSNDELYNFGDSLFANDASLDGELRDILNEVKNDILLQNFITKLEFTSVDLNNGDIG